MKIVGIAACPAGLAHTPMAAKALEEAGDKLGVSVKIEQQGIMGQINKITKEEAQCADLVLIVSTLKLEGLERFSGKPKVKIAIGDAVVKSEIIIEKCIKKIKEMKEKNE